ncbi:MAG: TonB-dependent receptor [Gemmatimonadaceae bacterium]
MAGVAAVFALAGESLAQTRLLSGVVRDSLGAAIVAASVALNDEATRTDSAGTFVLVLPRADSITIVIRRMGYEQMTFTLSTDDAAGNTVEVVLNQVAHALGSVEVQGMEVRASTMLRNFDERRAQGIGRFISREEIERRNPSQLSQMLRDQAGLIVYPPRNGTTPIQFAMYQSRTCQPSIFVDGQYAAGIDINTVHPFDIEGVEIYRTLGSVPPEFIRGGGAGRFCGAIAIWTKRPIVMQSVEKTKKP